MANIGMNATNIMMIFALISVRFAAISWRIAAESCP